MSQQLETLTDFYRERSHINFPLSNNDLQSGKSHFNVNTRKYCNFKSPYNRRDFYKITLILGTGELCYGGNSIIIDRPALLLPCPSVPYSWTSLSDDQDGYYCLFNQEFFNEHYQFDIFKRSSLFKAWSEPVIFLDDKQLGLITLYFEQMMEMAHSDYTFKYEAIRNLLCLLMHSLLVDQPDGNYTSELPASSRLLRMFDELLHQQFPLDSPAHPLTMKTPADFARALNVHVNHLNSVIKSTTGSTTTAIIKSRVLEEAKTLLQNTQWDISQVGYCLGFEEPAHFNHFFKKAMEITPLQFRQSKLKAIL
ncbi:AraC family transcriptional regulator [Chitinophaga filiformis]|uniref:helix-turn-helix domain-containing protein n=1 Tax=Chitinophaga filiformis TaxID=104663 RepID=UPI001F205A12|nr:AraC family transcriptional regulator [Chitinophaga filiformis]MCF6404488.1 AraC family transcriptional regulator [Chitinophaga filiformis]